MNFAAVFFVIAFVLGIGILVGLGIWIYRAADKTAAILSTIAAILIGCIILGLSGIFAARSFGWIGKNTNPVSESPSEASAPTIQDEEIATPPSIAPEQAASQDELLSVCWSESPDTFRPYLATKETMSNGLHVIAYSDLKSFAVENDGFFQFEGRLPGVDIDRTDIFIVNHDQAGVFSYREGSFWFYSNECSSYEGKLISLDRTAAGKWDGRVEQNLISGFLMVVHDPEQYNKVYAFDANNPYKPLSEANKSFDPKSCEHLKTPLRQEFYGEIDGVKHNYSFGAINCQSVTFGNFEDGFKAMLFDNAQDNVLVTFDAQLEHHIFPANWSGSMMKDWILTQHPGIVIYDPEGVLK